MPLITHRDKRKKIALNTEILVDIDAQIKQYCEWSGVIDLGLFIEEAAKYIFSNDMLWQKHLAEKRGMTETS